MATAPGTAGRTHRLQGFRCRTRPAAGSRWGVTAAAYALLSLFLHMMLRLGSLPFARLCVAREREAFAYLPRFHPGNDLSTLLPARAPEPYPPSSSRICDADGCRASQIREIVAPYLLSELGEPGFADMVLPAIRLRQCDQFPHCHCRDRGRHDAQAQSHGRD